MQVLGDDTQDRYQMPGEANEKDDNTPEGESHKRWKSKNKKLRMWKDLVLHKNRNHPNI